MRWIIPSEDANIVSTDLNPSTIPSSPSSPIIAHELILVLSTPSELVVHSIPLPPPLFELEPASTITWNKAMIERGVLERTRVYAVDQSPGESVPKVLNIRTVDGSSRSWCFDVVRTSVALRRVFVRASMSTSSSGAGKKWKVVDVREEKAVDRCKSELEQWKRCVDVPLATSLRHPQHPSTPLLKTGQPPSCESHPVLPPPRGIRPRVIGRKTFRGKQCTVKGHDAIFVNPSPSMVPPSRHACSDYHESSHFISIVDFHRDEVSHSHFAKSSASSKTMPTPTRIEMNLVLPNRLNDRKERGGTGMGMGMGTSTWKVVGWDTICGRAILSSSGVGGGVCFVDY